MDFQGVAKEHEGVKGGLGEPAQAHVGTGRPVIGDRMHREKGGGSARQGGDGSGQRCRNKSEAAGHCPGAGQKHGLVGVNDDRDDPSDEEDSQEDEQGHQYVQEERKLLFLLSQLFNGFHIQPNLYRGAARFASTSLKSRTPVPQWSLMSIFLIALVRPEWPKIFSVFRKNHEKMARSVFRAILSVCVQYRRESAASESASGEASPKPHPRC
jgi:hypothetical protein